MNSSNDQLPNLGSLQFFHHVALTRSFSAAARALHVTQGAISHRIRALEEELGCRLFVRGRRPIALTQAGEVLLSATTAAFSRLRAGMVELDELRHGVRLSISCSPSFALRWLVPHLPEFRAHAPELDVRIDATDALVRPGIAGIDVCVRFGPGGYAGVDAEPLTHERLTPVCSPLLLERQPIETVDDLANHTLLHDVVLANEPSHVGWAEWLDCAGDTQPIDPSHGLTFSHAYMALDAALAGQGVALARRTLVARDIAEGRLVAPLALSVPTALRYWLLTVRGARETGPVALFCQWIQDRLRSDDRLASPSAPE